MHSKSLDLLTTYQLNIMKILVLIFGVMSSESHLELIKVPITKSLSNVTCDKALETIGKWQENPNFTEGNNELWGYYTYKNKPIMLHY